MTAEHVEQEHQTPPEEGGFDLDKYRMHNPKLYAAISETGRSDLVNLLEAVLPEAPMAKLRSLMDSGVTAAQARALGITLEASTEGEDRRRILAGLESGLAENAALAISGGMSANTPTESPVVAEAKRRAEADTKRLASA